MNDLSDDEEQLQKLPKSKEADKAELILTGAMEEFLKRGYASASMDRIAVAAGVSKPTLYSYFRDKAGLFAALIQRMVQGNRKSRWIDNEEILHLPLRESLRQIATASLDTISGKQPLFTVVRLIIGESGRFPALAQTFVRKGEKPMLEQLTHLFANHPELNVRDPEVLAHCFHGSIVHYTILQEILHGRDIVPLERDRFVEGLIDLVTGDRPDPPKPLSQTEQAPKN